MLKCSSQQGLLVDMGMPCRVVWAPDGQAVASASDDRSVMIWQLPEQAHSPADSGTSSLEAASVLTGHQARLWDAKFAGDLVITASEDCTCRYVLLFFLLSCLRNPIILCGTCLQDIFSIIEAQQYCLAPQYCFCHDNTARGLVRGARWPQVVMAILQGLAQGCLQGSPARPQGPRHLAPRAAAKSAPGNSRR